MSPLETGIYVGLSIYGKTESATRQFFRSEVIGFIILILIFFSDEHDDILGEKVTFTGQGSKITNSVSYANYALYTVEYNDLLAFLHNIILYHAYTQTHGQTLHSHWLALTSCLSTTLTNTAVDASMLNSQTQFLLWVTDFL